MVSAGIRLLSPGKKLQLLGISIVLILIVGYCNYIFTPVSYLRIRTLSYSELFIHRFLKIITSLKKSLATYATWVLAAGCPKIPAVVAGIAVGGAACPLNSPPVDAGVAPRIPAPLDEPLLNNPPPAEGIDG